MSIREASPAQGFSAEDEEILVLLLAEEGIELAPAETAIAPAERSGDLPLSFAQERLWLVEQLAPGSAAYHLPAAIRLTGALADGALAAAFAALVGRHEALRTVFPVRAGAPAQVILPAAPQPLPRVDLSTLPVERRDDEARRLAAEEARRPFDLAAGPLLRTALLRLTAGVASHADAAAGDHLLLMTLHHIVSDGWSQGILVRELGALYAAAAAGRPSPLPPLAIQYADFAVWQRRALSGAALAGELDFWRRQLAGLRRVELPADRPRPAAAAADGGRHHRRLPAAIEAGLASLARREGATLYMALLAAVMALIARHTGEADVAVGSPIANRTRAETEGLIGFFVNTLVLRADLGGEPTWRQLLGRVRETVLAAFAHQDLPFERVVEELAPQRDASRTPLFQTMFALQNAAPGSGGELRLPGLTLRPLELDGEPAKFDLTLAFAEEGGLRGTWGYDRDLFDASTVARLASHLEILLAAALAAAESRVADLPLLTAGERSQIVEEWNATATSYPRQATIQRLFRQQLERGPERVAAVWGDRALTYGELGRRSSRLARRLRALDLRPEPAVGLFLPRSLDLLIAMLAVLEAGGAYVPLDTGLPRERLELLLRDVGAAQVVTRAELRSALPVEGVEALLLDLAAAEESVGGEAEAAPPAASPDGLAYVIYTSGSTGSPKGVAVPHRAVVRLVRDTDYVSLGPGDRVAHLSNPAFDAATFEIWGALLNGGRLEVIDRDLVLAPRELGRLLVERGVSALFVTTALFNQLAAEVPAALAAVGSVLFGGEQVDPAAVRRALAPAPRGRLLHVYGPTENTTFSTWHAVGAVAPGAVTVPIGRPLANSVVHLLDGALQPAPVGAAGELFTGGDGLARGYLGRPELTAERFVPDPFGAPGARLYRTGDLARRGRDGAVEFLGRLDDQVKIRGFRIEPGEVEAALRRHPEVREAAVLVREGAGGEDRRLVAFAAPLDGCRLTPAALRAFLKERLPDYLVPASFVLVAGLPWNANGKVDRRALLALDLDTAPETEGGLRTPPRTPTEELLQAIWSAALGIAAERLGTGDDFFALGGHSLLATRVVSRIRQTFGVELPLRRLFESPTIAALAREVDGKRAGGAAALPPIVPAPRDPSHPPPLSFAQERLWFLDQLQPGSALYNVPLAMRLAGDLDASALAAAVGGVVRRHEALRTTFAVAAGRPVQMVHAAGELVQPLIDLAALPPAGGEGEVRRLATAEAGRPFDLAAGPLLRATLLRLGAAEHAALVTLHHIVSDGWSMNVLVRELGELYAAARERRPPRLAPLPIQYADFALWQRQALAGERLEAELAYWRRALAGLATLELPTDRPRPPLLTSAGGAHARRLPAGPAAALAALARAEGATLYMALVAALAVVLGRHAGGDDVALGSPIANRNRAETEGLIGFFVNTLVLRTDCAGAPPFRTLLARVRETVLGAFLHQDLPFERVVEELAPQRDPSRTPLFQVMLALQNATDGAAEMALPGLTLRPLRQEGGEAKFDLTLAFAEGASGLGGVWGYNRDLFDATTVARLAGHFEILVGALLAAPERSIAELPLLSAAERAQLVEEWNATAAAYPREATLGELFARQAESTPEAIALVAGEAAVSYGELARRSRRLARRLAALGLPPEAPVALLLPRSFDLVVAMLAVAAAGGVYLPLDPGLPRRRLAFLLDDAGVVRVVTRRGLAGGLPDESPPVLLIEESGGEAAAEPPEPLPPLPPLAAADALAYVLYTSGSTGAPKGVAVPHRAVVRLVCGPDYVRFGPREVFLQLAPAGFDAATFEIWGALLHGARLVMAPPGALAIEEIGDLLARHQVTTLWLTAGLFHQVVDGHLELLRPVRQLLAGGDVLGVKQVAEVLAALPAIRLVNGYGPTENTTFTCAAPLSAATALGASVPLGRPIANGRVHLLDGAGSPVPIGVAGELCAGGDGLARGYLGQPALTAARFVPDPLGEPGGRLYRTGDLARRRRDGAIEFLGRLDDQVKIRGFRIEPGEVEAALRRHPGVREAAVLVQEGERGEDRRLVAFWSAADGGPAAPALRAFLQERLPEHLVPAALVPVETLPLTANGKVDRRALLASLAARAEPERPAGEPALAPRTPTEELLLGIWSETLGRDAATLGIDDDFFALGGHSLLATRVVSQVRQTLGVELPLRRLFEAPTIAALAREVDALRTGGEAALPPIVPVPRGGAGSLPLSFAQERLWFLDRLQPGGAVYNVPLALRLTGALDRGALAAALAALVDRHEAVRTTFASEGGRPVQVIRPLAAVGLPQVDLGGLAPAAREAAARHLALAEARAPFDLAAGPLLRGLLLCLSPPVGPRAGTAERAEDGEHIALVTLHHIVADGWSMGILVRELGALYAACQAGRPSPLRQLPVQYADFAVWQRAVLAGEVLAREIGFWRQALAGLTPLELPIDRPRPPILTSAGGTCSLRLPAALAAGLQRLARESGSTLYMALQAAVAALLARHTGGDDVALGSPIANRNRAETEGLIGFFVNTLVLRTDCAGAPAGRELLARVRETVLAAFAHQDLPFEKVVEELAPERDPSRTPLFQVMFVLQTIADELAELRLPGLTLRPLETAAEVAKFDLTLAFAPGPHGLHGTWSYNRHLFDRTTVARLAAHLEALVAGMIAAPERAVAELPLLGAGERAQLAWEWNATAAPFSRDATLTDLFRAQMERAPEAIAVVAGDAAVSYRELARRSARIAARLGAAGVVAGDLVGICAERSPALVAGILGIQAAGAAYVPLDPEYPDERLAFMLADAAPAALLATPRLAARLGAAAARSLPLEDPLDASPGAGADGGDLPPLAPLDAECLAYVLYTSGSTGRPKGVMVSHRAIVNHLLFLQAAHPLGAGDRVLQKTSVCFDVSVGEIFSPLLAGACLVLARPGGQRDPLYLAAVVEGEAITLLQLVPTLLQALLEEPWAASPPRALRRVLTGGEALSGKLVRSFFSTWTGGAPAAELVDIYGPTEAAIAVTAHRCGAADAEVAVSVPLGRTVANAAIHLLDRRQLPVPLGVAGELCIAGVCLGRGYLGRAELTAERFVPGAVAGGGDGAGSRLYRTGDLARRLPDGTLQFLGRLDHQVKIRGFRVELGEIEAVIAAAPEVREAAVAARGEGAGRQIAAYVVLRDGEETDVAAVAALRQRVRERLPEAMVPASWTVLAALPLAPNGKVDRAALPAPGAVGERARVAPRNALEQALAAIWEEILGRGPVGVTDDFFALGGHSFLAVRLLSRIARELGRELPLAALFEARTVESLAALLAAEPGGETACAAASAGSPLVLLQPAGILPPRFFVHPVGGAVFCYRDLAGGLGDERPFYGIQARALLADSGAAEPVEPLATVEEMAADYCRAIAAVQPAGPYHLGGWSFGGLVALAMARQLEARGERVAELVLLDPTTVPAALRGQPADEVAELLLVARDLGGIAGRPLDLAAGELAAADPSRRLDLVLERAVAAGGLPADVDRGRLRRLAAIYRQNLRAGLAYRPEPCAAPVTLVRPADAALREEIAAAAGIWEEIAGGGLTVVAAAGDHYSMLRPPQVAALCRKLASPAAPAAS